MWFGDWCVEAFMDMLRLQETVANTLIYYIIITRTKQSELIVSL